MDTVAPTPPTDDGRRGLRDHLSPICDPGRLLALTESGLGSDSDPRMEFYAAWVRRALQVPVALVSLVQADQQVFPGMAGLPEPWATSRSTPLSHSFCRHVVETAQPLIVTDARQHPLVRDNLAVADLSVIAYLGMPLTDDAHHVLGSLCAIDTVAREWAPAQIDDLRDIASACSAELRLRLSRVDAARERRRRDALEHEQRHAFDRVQTLLFAAQAFTDAATVDDVRTRLADLADSQLSPAYVGLIVLERPGLLRRVRDGRLPFEAEETAPWMTFSLDSPLPTATAVREQRIVSFSDRDSYDAAHDESGRRLLRSLGLHSVIAAPLPGPDGPLGCIVMGWDHPRVLDMPDVVTVTTIAGFAAQALGRAMHLHHREGVAHQLQRAMLTELPADAPLPMAAAYHPADAREDVGGDWYDHVSLSEPGAPGDAVLTLSVGDIVGHTLSAATIMGQTRSMLRQAVYDHPDATPAEVLTAFENANSRSGLHAAGSAVVVQLRRRDGRWSMQWTNAGHPPPILLLADGTTTLLEEHDILFGFGISSARHDHHRALPPGATLLLYTDGLVERRGTDIDTGIERLRGHLGDHCHESVDVLVDTTLATLTAAGHDDDVVAFAIRIPR